VQRGGSVTGAGVHIGAGRHKRFHRRGVIVPGRVDQPEIAVGADGGAGNQKGQGDARNSDTPDAHVKTSLM
jgi:hypothetical protein